MGHNSVTNININFGGALGGDVGGSQSADAQQALDSAAQKAGANIDDVNAGAKALGLDKNQLSELMKGLPPELQKALMKALEQSGKDSKESPIQKFLKDLEQALQGANKDQQGGAEGAGGADKGAGGAGGAEQGGQAGKVIQDLLQLFKDLLGGGGADGKAGGTNPFGGDHFSMTQTTIDTDMAPSIG